MGEPSVEAIAERAGVSYRSVYRYFEDRTELMLSAIARVMGDHWPIFDVEDLGDGSLDARIDRLIAVRLAAYRRLAPLTRIAIRRRADEPAVAEAYEDVREPDARAARDAVRSRTRRVSPIRIAPGCSPQSTRCSSSRRSTIWHTTRDSTTTRSPGS